MRVQGGLRGGKGGSGRFFNTSHRRTGKEEARRIDAPTSHGREFWMMHMHSLILSTRGESANGRVTTVAATLLQDKCHLSHEIRTMDNWRRFNRRIEVSAYRQVARTACQQCDQRRRSTTSRAAAGAIAACTCHQMLAAKLPHLKGKMFPDELWGEYRDPEVAAGRKRSAGGGGGSKSKRRAGLDEIDEGAAALLGDEALGPIKITSEEMKRGDGGEDGAEGGERERGGSDNGDADETLDDGEDLEENDYATNYFDDDEQLVDEGGGGSDDEEPTY